MGASAIRRVRERRGPDRPSERGLRLSTCQRKQAAHTPTRKRRGRPTTKHRERSAYTIEEDTAMNTWAIMYMHAYKKQASRSSAKATELRRASVTGCQYPEQPRTRVGGDAERCLDSVGPWGRGPSECMNQCKLDLRARVAEPQSGGAPRRLMARAADRWRALSARSG